MTSMTERCCKLAADPDLLWQIATMYLYCYFVVMDRVIDYPEQYR